MRPHIIVFISSSSEDGARVLRGYARERAERLTRRLIEEGQNLVIEPNYWEGFPAQRVTSGTVNDIFVERALNSDCVLAFLVRDLRPGTREEIEAVLGQEVSDVDLQILFYPPGGDRMNASEDVRLFLDSIQSTVLYEECGDVDDPMAVSHIDDVYMTLVARYLSAPREPYVEQRTS